MADKKTAECEICHKVFPARGLRFHKMHKHLGVKTPEPVVNESSTPAVEPVQATSVESPPSVEQPQPVIKPVKRRGVSSKALLLILSAILTAGGAFGIYVGFTQKINIVLYVSIIIACVCACWFYFTMQKSSGGDTVTVNTAKGKVKTAVNTIDLYKGDGIETNRIELSYQDPLNNPVGMLIPILNNGKKYYWRMFDYKQNKLVAFRLPNESYFDPQELAGIIPADPIRRYFELHIDLFEKLAPGMLVIVIIAELIFSVAMFGGTNGG